MARKLSRAAGGGIAVVLAVFAVGVGSAQAACPTLVDCTVDDVERQVAAYEAMVNQVLTDAGTTVNERKAQLDEAIANAPGTVDALGRSVTDYVGAWVAGLESDAAEAQSLAGRAAAKPSYHCLLEGRGTSRGVAPSQLIGTMSYAGQATCAKVETGVATAVTGSFTYSATLGSRDLMEFTSAGGNLPLYCHAGGTLKLTFSGVTRSLQMDVTYSDVKSGNAQGTAQSGGSPTGAVPNLTSWANGTTGTDYPGTCGTATFMNAYAYVPADYNAEVDEAMSYPWVG